MHRFQINIVFGFDNDYMPNGTIPPVSTRMLALAQDLSGLAHEVIPAIDRMLEETERTTGLVTSIRSCTTVMDSEGRGIDLIVLFPELQMHDNPAAFMDMDLSYRLFRTYLAEFSHGGQP